MNEALAGAAPVVISAQGIVKRYRLYQKPGYRFLDLFGLCPPGAAYYAEHTALDGVSLAVARGEKVAIIGRNGAGKSTLLKVITGLVRPSAGAVQVRGKVSNLLQIGSGFHPDFTGRQNVFAGLAHQGIIGAEADRIFKDVADFAEIDEYIDQPMKTYSTGMCSRLMFSSSVMTRPDVLIVDEILGVGDAYFSHKSFERMRQLCSGERTTLLLVTHDIYSAMNLCDRFIWIDRGRIMFDGDGKSAISLYESSVKEQEEQWLRQRHVASLAAPEGDKVVHVLVRSRTGFALSSPLAIGLIELALEDGRASTLRVSEGAPGWTLLPEGNLGPSQTVAGEPCRVLRPIGSIYHKAEWVVTLPPDARIAGARVRFRYDGDEPVDIRVFNPNRQLVLAGELTASRAWQESRFDRAAPGRELEIVKQTNYGTGLVQIVGLQFLDAAGRDVVEIAHGVPFTLRARLRVKPELRVRDVTLILGFARHESPYSAYVYEPRLTLPPGDECIVEIRLESVQLGSGQWYVNIGIGEIGLYDRAVINYFTVDGAWYHMLAARLELRVTSATSVDTFGCFFIHPATVAVLESAPVTVGERAHAG